ncbi:hypothetical protein [Actinoplanes utahensis]|uniref:hypothetical protein n=1 Tax=Actinoplanes utahensis TaxID=1869 RepID=UPI000AB03C5A|nr:hypothetical protein [Actinoplanes utahensis]
MAAALACTGTELFTGPVAALLGGVDLGYPSGYGVAATVYYLAGRIRGRGAPPPGSHQLRRIALGHPSSGPATRSTAGKCRADARSDATTVVPGRCLRPPPVAPSGRFVVTRRRISSARG